MDLKNDLKKASEFINNWQINEADKILNELYSKFPNDNEIKILLAVTQNSLRNQIVALQLVDSVLDSDSENQHAIVMYPSLVFELADFFIGNNDLVQFKNKLIRIEKMGFKKVGFDLGVAYKYLSMVYKENGDIEKAIDYLKLQKELYVMDDFLNESYVMSGDIDKKISLLTEDKNHRR